jgi:hypothetical protein
LKNFLKDQLDQVWTLVGLGIAWIVLEGSAKDFAGWAILVTLFIWTATYPLRKD